MASILPSHTHPHAHRSLLDRIGATGSLLCAVHCAAVPLVLAVAPAIGAGFANHGFEIGFIAFASLLGLTSLVLGYRLHRIGHALALLVPGIALLWCGVLVDALHENPIAHAIAMATGGTMLATAHVLNLRLSHAHAHGAACEH
ncbi:MAG TPA: MerC domain-containing protein [Xanthomonadaceae bacterium]|jgi:hypothetical protein